jgi:F-type H+-transporting ATPase subunit epsilon
MPQADSALRLVVLTPLATVLDGAADWVTVPLSDGWYGMLPGHAPFQARVLAGTIVLGLEGRSRLLATLGGTLMLEENVVTLLTGAAALDVEMDALERGIGDEVKRLTALEREAEKHFNQVYRQLARTFRARRRPSV